MVVGSFPNSSAMAEKLFRSLRPTSMAIRSLRVKCEFLAMVFSVSVLPSFGEDEGAPPLKPRGLSLLFPGRQQKSSTC